jgi:RNA polymerase sigma factor (sigma-70 family)
MDAGDLQQTRAFEEIVSEYAEGLYRFVYTILGNREDARDAAQRALLAAWQRFEELDTANMKGWLYRTAFNVSQEAVRRRKRSSAVLLNESACSPPTGADRMEKEEKGDMVRSAVMGLPERQRSVLVLRFYDSLPIRSIASVMGITEGGVKANISRGLGALRGKLAAAGLV